MLHSFINNAISAHIKLFLHTFKLLITCFWYFTFMSREPVPRVCESHDLNPGSCNLGLSVKTDHIFTFTCTSTVRVKYVFHEK